MSESPSVADWWAIVGPIARPTPTGVITTPHDRTAVLADRYRLGPILLRPGGRLLREFLRGEPQNLVGVTAVESYPIIVEGKWNDVLTDVDAAPSVGRVAAYAREEAAARVLHRVSCLLSLAWYEPWQVRTSAKSSQHLPPQIPHSWAEPQSAEGVPTFRPAEDLSARRRELPGWAVSAWDTLEDDEALQTALTFWHQGLHLTAEFPSFALVAIAASVEAVAGCRVFRSLMDLPSDPCPICGHIPRATARFWATMQLVASSQELDELKHEWDVYTGRSTVAHGSQTHAFEIALGPVFLFRYQVPTAHAGPSFAIDETNPAQRFVLQALPRFTWLASRLLLRALGVAPDEQEPRE